jgi:hypothetical protein
MTALWLLLKTIPPRTWAILALVALLVAGWAYERHQYGDRRVAAVQAKWDAQEAAYALQRAEAAIAARNTEARHRAEYRAIADRFLKEQADADKEHAAVVAALRSGELRVRHNLTCPSGRAEAPAGAQGTADSSGTGLLPEHVGFLLREAARADSVARQLNALIEAVKAGHR